MMVSPEKAIVEQAKRPSTGSEISSTIVQKSSSGYGDCSFSPYGFDSEVPVYQTVDLEGININDGLGYTVTITAGNGMPKRRRRLTRLSFQQDPGSLTTSDEKRQWEMGPIKQPLKALSRLSRRHALETVDEQNTVVEIHTRRSLEVKESFHTIQASSGQSPEQPSTTLSQAQRRYANWAIRTSATMSSFGSFLLDADDEDD
jgi:hypothetical protein